MASRAFWDPSELALLESHAGERNWFRKVSAQLPARTEAALRKQMFMIRLAQGKADRRRKRPWTVDARRGSRLLKLALDAAGIRP